MLPVFFMYVLLTSCKSQNYWAGTRTKLSTWKTACLPVWAGQRCSPALGHVSKCQDATDWIEAEDFPFLWFFCLFWVYTIIKKSLVLAGNGKTKQNKETALPWLIAAVWWPDLVKLFISPQLWGWGLQVENYIQRKGWKGQGCSFQKTHWI